MMEIENHQAITTLNKKLIYLYTYLFPADHRMKKGSGVGLALRLPKPKPEEVAAEKERVSGPGLVGPTIGILTFGAVMALVGNLLTGYMSRK